jgi:hypothetical protein
MIQIGLLVLEKISKDFLKWFSPLLSRPTLGDHDFCTISGSFCVNLSFSGFVVLGKKIFKWPHPIFAFL